MKRGFTIVELVMVIAIMGILLGIVTTAASGAIKQARIRKAQACCKVVQAAFETYYAQKGEWPGGIESKITGEKANTEGHEYHSDTDVYVLDPSDVDDMMRDILREYKNGNPCLDISGLFVSRYQGNKGSRDLGLDFMTAIRGTKKDANGQKMTTAQMHFGYPESARGCFRHFKVIYSKPTDQMLVKTHDDDWKHFNEGCCQ